MSLIKVRMKWLVRPRKGYKPARCCQKTILLCRQWSWKWYKSKWSTRFKERVHTETNGKLPQKLMPPKNKNFRGGQGKKHPGGVVNEILTTREKHFWLAAGAVNYDIRSFIRANFKSYRSATTPAIDNQQFRLKSILHQKVGNESQYIAAPTYFFWLFREHGGSQCFSHSLQCVSSSLSVRFSQSICAQVIQLDLVIWDGGKQWEVRKALRDWQTRKSLNGSCS